MKIQNIITLQLLLLASALHASDAGTLASVKQRLTDAQSALSATLGLGSQLPPPPGTTAISYKNATNISIVVSVAADGMISRQQILPGAVYTQNIIAVDKVAVQAHANVSPIFASYTQAASYSIAINPQGDIVLGQTAPTGAAIVNDTSWPMVVSVGYPNGDSDETTLQPGQRFTPAAGTINVMVIASIDDIGNDFSAGKPCTITNDKGELVLNF